ncbi:MAG: EAL domain-containing protein [Thiobacillus sp.]|nr:EAL domain-containing protein [Thiobacillus sp.]
MSAPAPSSHKPVRGLFYLLIGFFVAVYGLAIARLWVETRRDAEANLRYLDSMLVQNTRATLRNYELILRGIGHELLEHDMLRTPEKGRDLIERMRAIDPGMAGFGLARPDGQLLLISGIPAGAPLPNLLRQAETRDSFLKCLHTRKLEIGRPYFMQLLKQWVIPLRVPLLDARGEPVAVMTAGYPIASGNTLLASASLPQHTATVLLRDDGYLQYVHPLPVNQRDATLRDYFGRKVSPAVLRTLAGLHAPSGTLIMDLPDHGGRHLVAYDRIAEYGLRAGAIVPFSTLVDEWLRRLLMPTLLLAVFLAGAILVYRRTLRRQRDADATLVERNDSLRAINQLSNRIHASLELDDILREAISALAGLSHAPHVAVYLLNHDHGQLELAASSGFNPDFLALSQRIPLAGSLCGEAVTRKQLMISEDFREDVRIQPVLRENLASVGLRTGLVVPLVYREQVFGGLNVVYAERHAFSDIELDTFSAVAHTVALAIANARHANTLAYQARHDSLTRLPNRTVLHGEFAERIGRVDNRPSALMLLDLDRFKDVNDTLGHHVGDHLLTCIGPRLETALGDSDALVCRLGGDEFALLVAGVDSDEAVRLAQRLKAALREPFSIQGIPLQVGASIGIALYPEHGDTSHDLLRAADVAMYQAKQNGAGIDVYDRSQDTYNPERLKLAVELAHAVECGELVLHYQPKIDLASRRVTGFEALVRWQHPRRGLLLPGEFVDLAEMNEMIHPFTRAILDRAVADKGRLAAHGYAQPIAINLSARNLLDERFAVHLKHTLDAGLAAAGAIGFELTETALMQDPETSAAVLREIARLGSSVAVDDYGTGYSSLAYLRRLPLSALKIDRTFVLGMVDNVQDAIIVRSTIALAHNLGLAVIAEGVENAATADALRSMGCDQAQGYHISRPLPLDDLIAWLDADALAAA